MNALHGLLFQNIEMLKGMKLQDEMYQNAPNQKKYETNYDIIPEIKRSRFRTPSPKRKRYSSDRYQNSRDRYHYSSDKYRDSVDRKNRSSSYIPRRPQNFAKSPPQISDLTVTTQGKSTVEISQKFVAFLKYMNLTFPQQKPSLGFQIQGGSKSSTPY